MSTYLDLVSTDVSDDTLRLTEHDALFLIFALQTLLEAIACQDFPVMTVTCSDGSVLTVQLIDEESLCDL